MNVRVKRVALAREAEIVTPAWLTLIGFANRRTVLAHPIADCGQYAHRFFRNRAVRLRSDVQKIVASVARAADQVANHRGWAFPIKIRGVITPTVVERHA